MDLDTKVSDVLTSSQRKEVEHLLSNQDSEITCALIYVKHDGRACAIDALGRVTWMDQ